MGYALSTMDELTPIDRGTLINALAGREGTAKQIASWYDFPSVQALKEWVEENKEEIQATKDRIDNYEIKQAPSNVVTPTELEQLWITNKFARLARYETIANLLFDEARRDPTDSTVLRELRSYLVAAANELGQLLHRGSGESGTDSLSVDIQGIDLENLK